MIKIFSILLSVGISLALPQPFYNGKIVGGIAIEIDDAPYQVSLQIRRFHTCGGSIISENFVLTACHCTEGSSAKDLQIRVGSSKYSSGGIVVPVARIIQHEMFDFFTIDYDFSLLELATSLMFSDKIQPIALPTQDEQVDDNSLCFVSGWGNTKNAQETRDKLRAAYVPSVNQNECQKTYDRFGDITDRMICAGYKKGGKDACQGDSGGPLVSNNKLIGVVSWGYMCAQPDYPGVYSRVASVRSWIDENTGI